MKIFLLNQIYDLKVELKKGTISNYTAEILEEDDQFLKFKDKFGEEVTVSKDIIKFSKIIK
jgi:hypothetical protein